MLDRLSDQLLHLDGSGKCVSYADYGQWLQAQEKSFSEKSSKKQGVPAAKVNPKNQPKKLSYEERKELSRIEGKIEKAQNKVEQLKTQYADPAIVSDPERLLALAKEINTAEEAVDQLYRRWEVLDR